MDEGGEKDAGERAHIIISMLRERGEKITPARKGVLEIMADTDQLLNVAEIYEVLRNKGIRVNYSTVYRTLDFFQKGNFVEKLEIMDETKYKLLGQHNHIHHLICKICHGTEPLNYCSYEELKKAIKAHTNFLPVEHRLEIYGYCEKCRKKHGSNLL